MTISCIFFFTRAAWNNSEEDWNWLCSSWALRMLKCLHKVSHSQCHSHAAQPFHWPPQPSTVLHSPSRSSTVFHGPQPSTVQPTHPFPHKKKQPLQPSIAHTLPSLYLSIVLNFLFFFSSLEAPFFDVTTKGFNTCNRQSCVSFSQFGKLTHLAMHEMVRIECEIGSESKRSRISVLGAMDAKIDWTPTTASGCPKKS